MPLPTLLDIAKLNLGDKEVGLIEEAVTFAPEISGRNPLTGAVLANVAAARSIKTLSYPTVVRTAVPRGGSFRKANDGVDPSKSTFENRLVQCQIFDKRFEVDKAIADTYEDGWAAYLAIEAGGIMEGGVQDWSQQFYYGTNATFGDASGHPGLLQFYDTAAMEVDAGGTTANTASSVWGVKWGVRDVRHVLGNMAEFAMSDVRVETITGQNGKKLDGYVQTLLFYPGIQQGHKHSVGRIKKLTADAGCGLTDARLGQLRQKFLEQRKANPDVFFATPRSIEQLRASRTATNGTGAEAPTPTEFEGIPIVPTLGILNTEALTL